MGPPPPLAHDPTGGSLADAGLRLAAASSVEARLRSGEQRHDLRDEALGRLADAVRLALPFLGVSLAGLRRWPWWLALAATAIVQAATAGTLHLSVALSLPLALVLGMMLLPHVGLAGAVAVAGRTAGPPVSRASRCVSGEASSGDA